MSTEPETGASQELLHTFTYSNPGFSDCLLDDNLPNFAAPLGNGACHLEPNNDAGAVDKLPLEMIYELLAHLDLETLMAFRRVNQRAKSLVDSFPQYRTIAMHARDTLRGALCIGLGSYISCKVLYAMLFVSTCASCGEFGSYAYLLTCSRVCFPCLVTNPIYLPISPRRAYQKFGLNKKATAHFPSMRALPGVYSPNEKKLTRSPTLIDFSTAQQARATVLPRNPSKADPFDAGPGNPLRFVAIARIPWINTKFQEVERGFHCIGCKEITWPPFGWRRKFTRASFGKHIREYGDIKGRKHVNAKAS